MAEKHLYEIKHIETSFRTDGKMFKAIEDVSLYLNPGEIIGIVGESGSGKSVTMMSALQLIQEPGKVLVEKCIWMEMIKICWNMVQTVLKSVRCVAEESV